MTEDEYFNHLRRRINEVLDRDRNLLKAIDALMTITDDEGEKVRLMSEFKGLLDYQSEIGYAKREERRKLLPNSLLRNKRQVDTSDLRDEADRPLPWTITSQP